MVPSVVSAVKSGASSPSCSAMRNLLWSFVFVQPSGYSGGGRKSTGFIGFWGGPMCDGATQGFVTIGAAPAEFRAAGEPPCRRRRPKRPSAAGTGPSDPITAELLEDPHPQLSCRPVVLPRPGEGHHPNGHPRLAGGLHTGEQRTADDDIPPRLFGGHADRGRFRRGAGGRQVRAEGHDHIDERLAVGGGVVADRADVPVRHVVHDAV